MAGDDVPLRWVLVFGFSAILRLAFASLLRAIMEKRTKPDDEDEGAVSRN
jgi:membrane protein implicated in regulation of membrane protease activity